jgi:hypothetical protein
VNVRGATFIFASLTLISLPLLAQAAPPTEAEFAREATWQQPTAAEVRADVIKWLDEEQVQGDVRAKIEALWPGESQEQDILERVGASLAAADPHARELVELCSKPRTDPAASKFDWLSEDEMPVFARNNLRLIYGRWLAQNQMYDEALVQLNGLDAKDVVDPAALFFYQGVANHWLLKRDEAAQALSRLMERKGTLPRRYESLADLMTGDFEELEDDSLDHISRRMDDIKRRLELARVGKTVRGIEDGVIESLDKLIEDMEKQRQQRMMAMSQGSGKSRGNSRTPPRGIQSNTPAEESRAAEGKGAGEVTKRPIGNKSGWGDLPPKEREEALQQIGKDFPSHYRDAIEQYFRRLASEGSDKSGP